MTATNEQQLQYYFGQLSEAEQNSFLQLLQAIISGKKHRLDSITIEQYNAEIDEALSEIVSGETLSHEEVAELSKRWL